LEGSTPAGGSEKKPASCEEVTDIKGRCGIGNTKTREVVGKEKNLENGEKGEVVVRKRKKTL